MRLLDQAAELPQAGAWRETLEAVRAHRSLLASPDPVAPVLQELGAALRSELAAVAGQYAATFEAKRSQIESDATWSQLPQEKRQALLAAAGARERPLPATGSDEELLAALSQCGLGTWRSHADALTAQFAKAQAAAIQDLEPKARRFTPPSATIRNSADLDAWLAQTRAQIEAALKEGPVIL